MSDSQNLNESVKAALNELLGFNGGSYNLDAVRPLATAVEACQYAIANMYATARFPDRESLIDFCLANLSIEGLLLECGVWQGSSVNLIADRLPGQQIYGFDSFEGLPEPWQYAPKGTFALAQLPVVRSNVQLIVGLFEQTLAPFVQKTAGEVAFLHVDCDLYSSTRVILTELHPRIVPGTILLFDEYLNYPTWKEHEWRAFQEYVRLHDRKYEYIGLVPAQEQVAVRILA